MRHFLTDPRRLAPWYQGTGTTLSVVGMLVAALAIGGH
jgi:chlorophyll synthase